MALLICPECKTSVSEYATCCPKCGCPSDIILKRSKENNIMLPIKCPICGVNVREHSNGNKCGVCGYDFTTSKEELDEILHNPQPPAQPKNIPHCPTCGSTNIRKIKAGERTASIIGFGIFSRKANKTWKCENCGHLW